jgi:hypothetical protein
VRRPALDLWAKSATVACEGGALDARLRGPAWGQQIRIHLVGAVHRYTSEEALEQEADSLRTFLVRMGTEGRQGAVGLVIDRDYLEIRLPLDDRVAEDGEEH